MLAQIRHRYEETPDSHVAIAHDAGTSTATIGRLAREQNWVRFRPGARDFSPAEELAAQTRALVEGAGEGAAAPTEGGEKPDLPALIGRLARLLEEKIAAHEAETARLKGVPQSFREARRAAHDLVALKAAAQDLNRLLASQKESAHVSAYDRPADIDARRDALAQRIRAFIDSRRGARPVVGPSDEG